MLRQLAHERRMSLLLHILIFVSIVLSMQIHLSPATWLPGSKSAQPPPASKPSFSKPASVLSMCTSVDAMQVKASERGTFHALDVVTESNKCISGMEEVFSTFYDSYFSNGTFTGDCETSDYYQVSGDLLLINLSKTSPHPDELQFRDQFDHSLSSMAIIMSALRRLFEQASEHETVQCRLPRQTIAKLGSICEYGPDIDILLNKTTQLSSPASQIRYILMIAKLQAKRCAETAKGHYESEQWQLDLRYLREMLDRLIAAESAYRPSHTLASIIRFSDNLGRILKL